jgi:hypothetical protein
VTSAAIAAAFAPGASAAIPDIKAGFGETSFTNDSLKLGSGVSFSSVDGYLDHLRSDEVHVRAPWCRLEPQPGVYPQTDPDGSPGPYATIRTWVATAAHASTPQNTLITIDTRAPVFARTDAMQKYATVATGGTKDLTGCARVTDSSFPANVANPPLYPAGDPAPAPTDQAIRHYADTIETLLLCLSDKGVPGTCPAGRENLLPHVTLEFGAETNWWNSWATGLCTDHTFWYQHPTTGCGDDNEGYITRTDADLYRDVADNAARTVATDPDTDGVQTSLGGIFFHNGDWTTTPDHPAGWDYLTRIYRAPDPPTGGWSVHPTGIYWDAVGLHLDNSCGDFPKPQIWTTWDDAGCQPDTINGRLAKALDVLNSFDPSFRPIWITGVFDASACVDGDNGLPDCNTGFTNTEAKQKQHLDEIWDHVKNSYYCGISGSGAHPVRHVVFARLVDPDGGHLHHIGLMTPSSLGYQPKAAYDISLGKGCP